VPAPDRRRFSRHPARTGRTLCLGFCLVAALLAPAAAEDERPDEQLKAVEKALDEGRKTQARYAKEAENLAAELARLRDSSVTAAQAVQAGLAELLPRGIPGRHGVVFSDGDTPSSADDEGPVRKLRRWLASL